MCTITADIDATVAKLQVQEDKGEENEERGREVWRERGRQDDGGGGGNGNESVDYAENPACSGGTLYVHTNNCCTCPLCMCTCIIHVNLGHEN